MFKRSKERHREIIGKYLKATCEREVPVFT